VIGFNDTHALAKTVILDSSEFIQRGKFTWDQRGIVVHDGKDVDENHYQRWFWGLNVKTKKKPESIFDFHDLNQELVTI